MIDARRELPGAGTSRRRFWVVTMALAILSLPSCGLPGSGSATRIDDDAVPYRLLEPAAGSGGASSQESRPRRAPIVYWLAHDSLVPEGTEDQCDEPPRTLVEHLLATLATGPSEESRAAGKSSAIPPGSGLQLVSLVDETATVDIDPGTSLNPERLPMAMGQVVLTVTSAPTVRSVVVVSDGERVQVPLPGGVLTDDPVTTSDYSDLLSNRYQGSTDLGCPQH